jgi:predicted transposase/invertase (TIGR01784 family)
VKTDTLFYQLFQNFPSIFFELIGQPTTDTSIYQFTAPEVKQRAFRFDGLFLPIAESSELPIYFVEVQFQKKPKFYSRLFAEIFLYFINMMSRPKSGTPLSSTAAVALKSQPLGDIGN